jgi:hypothetical protein
MIDVSSVSDFNLHFVSQYSSRSFLVAGRFFDLTKDWERLACEWYGRKGFRELKNDRYIGQLPDGRDAIRYHSVDALVLENPERLSDIGQHLYDSWLGIKANLAKHRSEPPVVILPPPQEPPMWEPDTKPVPKPVELPPKKEEPKKHRPEWQIKFGVWLTVLTPVVAIATIFLPPPWNMLGKAIFEAIKLLIGG